MKRILAVILQLFVFAAAADAQAPTGGLATEAPSVVVEGLDAYVAGGEASAVPVWLRGAVLDSAKQQTLLDGLGAVREQAGAPIGYDIVHVWNVGPNFQRSYVVLRHERAPAFLSLEYYHGASGWVLRNITFNTDPKQVFPATLLGP